MSIHVSVPSANGGAGLRIRVAVTAAAPLVVNNISIPPNASRSWAWGMPQARFPGPDNGLRPIGYLELAQDIGYVVSHGFRAQHESGGDFKVLLALRDEFENLTLAIAQLGEYFRQRGGSEAGEKLHQPRRDPRAEDCFAFPLGRLVQALGWFWYLRGHLNVGRPWLEKAVSAMEPGPVQAGALLSLGWLAYGRGELELAGALCEQSLASGGDNGNTRTTAIALTALSFTLRDRGAHERSRPLLDLSLALSREINFRWGEGWSLYLMNQEALFRGDLVAVAECCDLALPLFRELGERLGLAYTLKDLARLRFEQGDYERAIELEQESLALSRELGNRRGICFALTGLAGGARRQGEFARAADLLRQVLAIWQELGNRPRIANTLSGIAALVAAQGHPERAARLFGAAEAERESSRASPARHELRIDTGYDESVASASHGTRTACLHKGVGSRAEAVPRRGNRRGALGSGRHSLASE